MTGPDLVEQLFVGFLFQQPVNQNVHGRAPDMLPLPPPMR